MSNPELIQPPRPGQPISAAWMRQILSALRRKIHGPGVIADDTGWYIPDGRRSGGEGGYAFMVMRELDTSPDLCKMQEVVYDQGANKLDGESDFPYHIKATGAIIEVMPPPTGTYAMFDAKAALRPVADALDPENLSSAPLWLVDRSKGPKPWAMLWLKGHEHMEAVVASGS